MSIESLVEYMNLLFQGAQTAPQRKAILEKQREQIKQHIAELQEALKRLDHQIECYDDIVSDQDSSMLPSSS